MFGNKKSCPIPLRTRAALLNSSTVVAIVRSLVSKSIPRYLLATEVCIPFVRLGTELLIFFYGVIQRAHHLGDSGRYTNRLL